MSESNDFGKELSASRQLLSLCLLRAGPPFFTFLTLAVGPHDFQRQENSGCQLENHDR
jgi:hypothetical protein